MTKQICIIDTPLGTAPKEIRDQWVGVTLPVATEEEVRAAAESVGDTYNGPQPDYYDVRGDKAVQALSDAGRREAVEYWGLMTPFNTFRFAASCCTKV